MTVWAGRVVGTLAGAVMMQNPFGVILGALVGFMFDRQQNRRQQPLRLQQGRFQEFSELSIVLAVKLAQMNGAITREQVTAFKQGTMYDRSERDLVGQLFNRARNIQADVAGIIRHLGMLGQANPQKLMELYHLLDSICMAGGLSDIQQDWLERCGRAWGLPVAGRRTSHQHSSGQYQRQATKPALFTDIDRACDILGVTTEVTLEELKDTYKSLAKAYHPDLLRAKNVSDKRLEAAEDKLRQINDAYALLQKHIQS